MMTPALGKLKRIDLRSIWDSEASAFTPWLAAPENLSLLAEAIGIPLELECVEKNVGPFRADIVCRDVASDQTILIENQLERTDHSHLGQLLTYAAGLDAVTIVWIAARFTEEHRAALDWLNEKTPEEIHFFGLEVEVWQIEDSKFAPKFNVVVKPNEWVRTVAEAAKNSAVNELRWAYWKAFCQRPELAGVFRDPVVPTRKGNLNLPTGWRNFKLSIYFVRAQKRLGVYVMCRGESGFSNFTFLQERRKEIEAALGVELQWIRREEEQRGWISQTLLDCEVENETDWPRQHEWLARTAVAFFKAFGPPIGEVESTSESVASSAPA